MRNKLFIIGNGFDLAHKLPTQFDPDFKKIAIQYEQNNFWDLYQSSENDIWSDFENFLDVPTLTLSKKSLMAICQIIYQTEKVIVIVLSIRWN